MRRSWPPWTCGTRPRRPKRTCSAAVAPLGGDYAAVLRRAFNERWLDWYPAEGKRSGAYSNGGAYDVHPYILLNYLGKYNDVSTLAHELGHTMHSYYSNKIAAVRHRELPDVRRGSGVDVQRGAAHRLHAEADQGRRRRGCRCSVTIWKNIKATVFRQTQFAEFELRMHEMAEAGEPITGDALATLYLDITKRLLRARPEVVTVVDDYVAHEWSYIPHFYSDFYVFQYATSFTAAEALARQGHRRGRGGDVALPDLPRLGRVDVSDRLCSRTPAST